MLIPKGGDNRLFRKASGLCYFAGLRTQSHATSITCLVHRRLSHLSDIFIHGRGHPTMIRYFEFTVAKLMLVHSLNDTRISACPTACSMN